MNDKGKYLKDGIVVSLLEQNYPRPKPVAEEWCV